MNLVLASVVAHYSTALLHHVGGIVTMFGWVNLVKPTSLHPHSGHLVLQCGAMCVDISSVG